MAVFSVSIYSMLLYWIWLSFCSLKYHSTLCLFTKCWETCSHSHEFPLYIMSLLLCFKLKENYNISFFFSVAPSKFPLLNPSHAYFTHKLIASFILIIFPTYVYTHVYVYMYPTEIILVGNVYMVSRMSIPIGYQ